MERVTPQVVADAQSQAALLFERFRATIAAAADSSGQQDAARHRLNGKQDPPSAFKDPAPTHRMVGKQPLKRKITDFFGPVKAKSSVAKPSPYSVGGGTSSWCP
eukprot:11494108-Karenia_brevis.AAC.1